MKTRFLTTLGLGLLLPFVLVSCSDKSKARTPGTPKVVAKAVEAEAENMISDAMFAMQVRDYARAEKGFARAVELRPDVPDWWESLGAIRKMQGKTGDARSAYKKALALWEDYYDETSDPQFGMHKVVLLVILDKADEARSVVEKMGKKHPNDQALQTFIKNKGLERMIASPDMQARKL